MSQDHINMQYHQKVKILVALQIALYYIFVYLLGVLTYYKLKLLNITIDTIAPSNSVLNSFYILGSILIATLILILIIKYLSKFPILKILEILIIFLTLSSFISLFIPDLFAIIIAIILLIIKEITKNHLLTNLLTSIMVGFIGGYIAYSLGVLPIIVLIGLIAIYDYISVFKTKHMVYLAKNIVDKNTSFTYEIKTGIPSGKVEDIVENKKNTLIIQPKLDLGTGDFALPLMAIIKFTFINSYLGLISLFGTIIVLSATLLFLIYNKNKVKALPAIPLQAITLIIIYIIYILFSYI